MVDEELDGEELDDEELREVEIVIEPRFDRLDELGVSLEDFEEAISTALDEYHDLVESQGDPDETPSIDQIKVHIGGKDFLLGELAEIQISDDLNLN